MNDLPIESKATLKAWLQRNWSIFSNIVLLICAIVSAISAILNHNQMGVEQRKANATIEQLQIVNAQLQAKTEFLSQLKKGSDGLHREVSRLSDIIVDKVDITR